MAGRELGRCGDGDQQGVFPKEVVSGWGDLWTTKSLLPKGFPTPDHWSGVVGVGGMVPVLPQGSCQVGLHWLAYPGPGVPG